jgi:hypothetical protein
MWTYVRVRSEYFENDSSRYRLAMSNQTLIESLKNQTDKNFSIVLSVSPMDPYYTRRLLSFDSVGVPWYFEYEIDLETPRRQVIVPDDYYLSPGLIQFLNSQEHQRNIEYDTSKGFLYEQNVLKEWESCLREVQVSQITDAEQEHEEFPWTWTRSSHQMNDDIEGKRGREAKIRWSGWKPAIVGRIARARIVTGSAMGCELHPTKSKSVVFANKKGRRYGN